jgi:protein arginine N-methyltransferase 1
MYPTRSFRLLEYHGNMLSDRLRVESYARAIGALVTPGMRVLDIGTGSGLLAMLAAQAGASRVDAVEVAEVVELAERLVRHNDLADVVRLHRGLSYQLQLPARADLLVTETLGNFGLEEGIMGVALDARARLLAPGAPLIPARVRLEVAPVTLPGERRKVDAWRAGVHGLDFSPVGPAAASLLWYARVPPDALLGEAEPLGVVDLRTLTTPTFAGRARLVVERDGELHGLAGLFAAELAPNVWTGNRPGVGAPSWRQGLLPLDSPWRVRAGEALEVEVETWDNGEHWRWRVAAEGRALELTTEQGYRSSLA